MAHVRGRTGRRPAPTARRRAADRPGGVSDRSGARRLHGVDRSRDGGRGACGRDGLRLGRGGRGRRVRDAVRAGARGPRDRLGGLPGEGRAADARAGRGRGLRPPRGRRDGTPARGGTGRRRPRLRQRGRRPVGGGDRGAALPGPRGAVRRGLAVRARAGARPRELPADDLPGADVARLHRHRARGEPPGLRGGGGRVAARGPRTQPPHPLGRLRRASGGIRGTAGGAAPGAVED